MGWAARPHAAADRGRPDRHCHCTGTGRYLGIEVDDAIEIAEKIEI
jgi:hypothetical protein